MIHSRDRNRDAVSMDSGHVLLFTVAVAFGSRSVTLTAEKFVDPELSS